jgi:methylaspartate mutase sigma subunit
MDHPSTRFGRAAVYTGRDTAPGTGWRRPGAPTRRFSRLGPTTNPPTPPRRQSVLVTSVSSDSHTWNLVYLQLLLEELGYRVHNFGACAPEDLVVVECLRTQPDLVVVSTVNGHGHRDGAQLIGRIRAEPGLRATPVVIGGKLGIAGPGGARSRDELRAAGFDAVYEADTGLRDFLSDLDRLTAGVGR